MAPFSFAPSAVSHAAYVHAVSLTSRVLIALALGIAVGLLLSTTTSPFATGFVAVVEPIGTVFINAIRMTVIPLVFSLLVVGVATAGDAASIGQLGWRAIATFFVMIVVAGVIGVAAAQPVFAHLTLDPAAVARVRASVPEATDFAAGAKQIPGLGAWFTSLVPPNPVKSAADGAMLPLIVFAAALGLSLLALPNERRAPVVGFFRGLADAMLVLVQWILVAAPVGVFALALPLVARLGMSAVSALAAYVAIVSLVAVVIMVLLYPAVMLVGGVSLRAFARAAAPAQGIAFSSRSSLAALPAMIEGAREHLGMSEEAIAFLIPLASAMFRIGASAGLTVGSIFLARLYGIELSLAQIATMLVAAVFTSFSVPGVPAAAIISMVPVLASVGLPLQGLGILLAVDTIPDSFRTANNVTGQLAAAAIVARRTPGGRSSTRP